jgi:hypothetical protein
LPPVFDIGAPLIDASMMMPMPDAAAALPDLAMAVPFSDETVAACGPSGTQSVISVAGNKVAVASLGPNDKTMGCTLQQQQTTQVPLWDICYGESVNGAKVAASIVLTQPYTSPVGVGMALSGMGKPSIAFLGGNPGFARCGASDLLLASDGNWGQPTVIATGSMSAQLVPNQSGNCVQNVCNSGDVVGFWPAIAFAPAGQPGLIWRDVHFGFALDDFAFSDVEYGPGPNFADLTVDVSQGGGTYNRIAFHPAGRPAIVHYNGDGTGPGVIGVWIDHQLADMSWERKQVNQVKVGEQLGFSIAPASGLHAIAFSDGKSFALRYQESDDGSTWSAPLDIDGGQDPSLAFDDNGDPAIAYYHCGDKSQVAQGCDSEQDGLRLARRKNKVWTIIDVTHLTSAIDGLYPALAFAGGKAVIAYQVIGISMDDAMMRTPSLHVAREP